jgi:Acetyltransferase (GNAT) domain
MKSKVNRLIYFHEDFCATIRRKMGMPTKSKTNAMILTTFNPEYQPLIHLWTEAFGEPAGVFAPVWEGVAPEKRWVATAHQNNELVASVMVYCFDVYGTQGETITVAGIANVSTLPQARGQGWSAKLLQSAFSTQAYRTTTPNKDSLPSPSVAGKLPAEPKTANRRSKITTLPQCNACTHSLRPSSLASWYAPKHGGKT